VVVSLLPLAFLLLGAGYLLAGVHAGRSADAGVERGFAVFVGCLGLAAVFVSGAELLRTSSIGTAWNGYLLAIAVYGTPTLYALAGVSWFAFVTRYVATVGVTFRQLVASLSIPVVLLMPIATTSTHLTDGDAEAFPLLAREVTPILRLSSYVVAPYHFALALGGVGVLAWAVYRYDQPSPAFATLLVVGGPLWYFSNYVTAPVLGTTHPEYYAINLVVGVVGLGAIRLLHDPGSLNRERPAASVLGRDELIDGLRDPVLAVDRTGRVVDGNPPATRLFDAPGTDLRGRPIEDVLPDGVETEPLREPGTHELAFPDARRFEITVSPITDVTDREFGRVLVFRDVTAERRREQRLQVLNRVLRHNLRNDGNFVDGAVERLLNDPDGRDQYARLIRERVRSLVDMGEKARTIEELVAADRRRDSPMAVDRIVRRAVERANDDADRTVTVDGDQSVGVVANDFVLEAIITELVENALEHAGSDPSVVIASAIDQSGALEITVTDDGPGIPEHEIAVLRTGEEGPLEHGSSIGLWLVKWGSERIGADFQFETPPQGGTRVVLRVPATLVVENTTAAIGAGRDDVRLSA
jgi:signal transduction histidine kinase